MAQKNKRVGVVGIPGGWSSEGLADALAQRTGFRLLLDPAELCLDLAKGAPSLAGRPLADLDGLVVKKLGPSYSPQLLDRLELLRYLDASGMPVFSPPAAIASLLNRLNCTVALRLAGIPMPPTWVGEDPGQAAQALARMGRGVLKPLFTSKARGMRLLEDGPGALAAIEEFQAQGNSMIYLQQWLPLPGRDLGVVFLGGRYVATYARVAAKQSWATTTAAGGKYLPHEITPEILAMAQKAQDIFNLTFTCVDVAETAQGPLVFEVSPFGGFRGLKVAHGLDAAGLLAQHVLDRLPA